MNKAILRGIKGSARSILMGLCVPLIVGVLTAGIRYPLGYIDCSAYGSAKELDTKYKYFECYVKDPQRGWLTQREYQSSVVGSLLRIG